MSNTSIGIVGLGYWGPNLVRNFVANPDADIVYACDLQRENRDKISALYPGVTVTESYEDLLGDSALDAIVIATALEAHHPLAASALEAGKQVLVEKPLASSHAQACELVALAKEKNLILMVDHTFVYEDAIAQMKRYIDDKALGDLLYFDSIRINLGKIQPDTNVLWDLAVHDLSILAYLIPQAKLSSVRAIGSKHYTHNEEDAHLHLEFEGGFVAHVHVSWLSPVKFRQTLLAGTEKMIVYNDNEPSEKIRLYDKGVEVSKEEQSFALPVYRSGDILIPRLKNIEPLKELARHFCACVRGEEQPLTPGEDGAKVVEILEKANESLKSSA